MVKLSLFCFFSFLRLYSQTTSAIIAEIPATAPPTILIIAKALSDVGHSEQSVN